MNIDNVIVDEGGKIVYYEFHGITQNHPYFDTLKLPRLQARPCQYEFGRDSTNIAKRTDLPVPPDQIISEMRLKDKMLENVINRKIRAILDNTPLLDICIKGDKPCLYTFSVETSIAFEH